MNEKYEEQARGFIQKENSKRRLYRKVLAQIGGILLLLILTFIVTTFFLGMVIVDGYSMYPTVHPGDILLYSKLSEFSQGDLAISKDNGVFMVKRVIACENQTVDIDFDSGEVRVDDKVLYEPYLQSRETPQYGIQFPQTVPSGRIFLLGDNRKISLDSRHDKIGMVDKTNIDGKVILQLRFQRFF